MIIESAGVVVTRSGRSLPRAAAETPHRIAVVGAGPIGTYAIAHLAALLPLAVPPMGARIAVFDRSGSPGAGEVHSDRQARTSYLNRVCGQIALAPDESNAAAGALLPPVLRSTFFEWCRERYARTGDPDFDLRPEDVPKRYVHGVALREFFGRYVNRLRAVPGVEVDVHNAEVCDVIRDGDGFTVLARGLTVPADHVLFATGHSWNRPTPGSLAAVLTEHGGARYVPTAYPLEERITERVAPPGRPVVVRGLGLAALDVFLHLTEGRGGRFAPVEGEPGELRYLPSGREPSLITGVSPSGVPGCSRPHNAKLADPARLEHRGVYFTVDAVARLRRTAGPCLDFDRHLLPLVLLEMAYVHYRTLLGAAFGERVRAAVDEDYRRFLAGDPTADRLLDVVEQCVDAAGGVVARFDPRAALDPLPADTADGDTDWHKRVLAHLRRDLANSVQGNVDNPVKAACDGVWRDLRGVFSAAVDHGGLTADSHREFVRRHLRHYNRLSNGAGIEPTRKLIALAEHGLLDLAVGPDPVVEPAPDGAGFLVTGTRTGVTRVVDVVVEGQVHPFDPEHDVSPLYRNLLRHGLVRQWRNPGEGASPDFVPGALDLTEDFHPVLPDGVEPRLTFLGAPVDGLRVFQLSAARPHSDSAVLNNAVRWARAVVAAMAVRRGGGR